MVAVIAGGVGVAVGLAAAVMIRDRAAVAVALALKDARPTVAAGGGDLGVGAVLGMVAPLLANTRISARAVRVWSIVPNGSCAVLVVRGKAVELRGIPIEVAVLPVAPCG